MQLQDGAKLDAFRQVSSILTGVAINSLKRSPPSESRPAKAGDLVPRNTPLDLSSVYLETLETSLPNPALLEGMLQVYADRRDAALKDIAEQYASEGKSISEVEAAALAHTRIAPSVGAELFTHPTYGPVCRCIMKLWFLGVWYSPDRPREPVRVISSQAYKEGLVWKIMQSHPQGYSMWSFGYWAEDPPTLEEFVTLV